MLYRQDMTDVFKKLFCLFPDTHVPLFLVLDAVGLFCDAVRISFSLFDPSLRSWLRKVP